jgi:hypothetical protein
MRSEGADVAGTASTSYSGEVGKALRIGIPPFQRVNGELGLYWHFLEIINLKAH